MNVSVDSEWLSPGLDVQAGEWLDVCQEVLEEAGSRYKMFDPTTWPQQAKLAADGEWEKLEKLQDELKGGKAS